MTSNRMLAPMASLASMAITLGLALASPAAWADTKKELVAKLLQLQQPAIEGLGNTLISNTANGVLQAVGRQMGRVPAEKREALGKELQADVKKFYDDSAPQLRAAAVRLAPSTLGAVYEEKLSEDELKTVIAWLESAASKKFQQIGNELQQNLAQKLITETKAQVEPKLKSLEKTLTTKLEAAIGSPDKPAPAGNNNKK